MSGSILRAFQWWTGALLACLPAVLRSGREPEFELTLGPSAGELRRIGARGGRVLGSFARNDATPRRARPRGARVIVRLAPGAALRTRTGLPAAAVDNLRSAIEAEMDRHTPFVPEDVRFDFRVEGADPDFERVFVEIELAQRAEVDAAIDFARRLGLRPARVCGAALATDGDVWPFDLAPRERPAGARGGRLVGALALILVLAAAGTGAAWLDRKERTLAAAEARLDALRAEAGAAANLAGRAASSRELAEAATARKAAAPVVTLLLNEAAARMPDGTWAESVEIAGETFRIAGRSDEAAPLLAAFEASAFFNDARFVAPVTREAGSGLERFELAVRIGAGAADGE